MSLNEGRGKNGEDVIFSPDSPTIDEGGSSGGSSSGGGGRGGVVLKKGPWTSAEDAILLEYVKKHGEGNWNAVQKYSGLSRCGKSCRLRWANHLRPNLKKGVFTPEEEHLIIELHAKMGNKWARMAAHLPGRTDNEIKNYWNTRIKRRQRAGLPLYPPELGAQAFQENQLYQNGDGLHGGDTGHVDPLQANGYDIADVMYGNLSTSQRFMPHIPPLPDFSASSSLMKDLGSQIYSLIPPTRSSRKRLLELEQHVSNYDGGIANKVPKFDRDKDGTSGNNDSQSFNTCFPDDPDAIAKKLLPFSADQGSQSLLTGNFSASKPIIGAVKLELPSLQYPETTLGGWVSGPSLPALESLDSFIQCSPSGPIQSDCPSPRSSGLLEALVFEAKALNSSKNPSPGKSSNSSVVTPEDLTDCSPLTMGSREYEAYGNPNSPPFGNSSGSIFTNCTPVSAARSSLEDNPSAEIFSSSSVKLEPIDPTWNMETEKNESSYQLKFLRPDAILDSCWLGQSVSYAGGQGIVTDAIAALLGDDLSSNFKNIANGSSSALGNRSNFGSCSWKNSPYV